jgi:site-specific DNA-adenine methylase
MFKTFQKEIFNENLVIGDEPNFVIAAKYVYVLCQVFSGSKPETSNYTDYRGKYRCKVLIFMDKLKKPSFREHFEKITFVENMDFQEVITKYDSPTTYFYMDPPYWKTENYYSNHDFDRNDHERFRVSFLCHTMILNFWVSGSLRMSIGGSVVLLLRPLRLLREKNKIWVRSCL